LGWRIATIGGSQVELSGAICPAPDANAGDGKIPVHSGSDTRRTTDALFFR
jgi:hypothetical protein